MSTPTKQEDRHEYIEVKPDYGPDPEEPAPEEPEESGRNERPWRSVWWWTTFGIPEKPQQRFDFFGIILALLVLEYILGSIVGSILRSIFGWPF